MQKLLARFVLVTLFVSVTFPLMAAEDGLVGHWKFDDVRSELRELKMVRGETFLPKEVFGFVKNSISKSYYMTKRFKQHKVVNRMKF